MSVVNVNYYKLGKALVAHGLVPANCRLLEVVLPAAGVPTLRYEKYLTDSEAIELAEALKEVAMSSAEEAS